MGTLNLGIVAHVDAGKTSLTERLLYAAGVIDEVGSVDLGSTRTDTLALERRRGITIKSAVVSFEAAGTAVNLIDTPGHPDFIAEVERVLSVLDGAVLVVSAVEGVQAQTRVLMRALRRLGVPTVVFVNKVDRSGAEPERVLREVAERLSVPVVAMGAVPGAGTADASVAVFGPGDAGFTEDLVAVWTGFDEELLAAYVADPGGVGYVRLQESLAAGTAAGRVHPVFFGSAITGAGVGALIDGLVRYLPSPKGDADAPVSGTVFKVERGPAGERVAYARLYAGTLRVRDRVVVGGREEKVTGVSVFDRGTHSPAGEVAAGRIARLHGLVGARVGDAIGSGRAAAAGLFTPPTLETVVGTSDPSARAVLFTALTYLAEQDPLIGLRLDAERGEVSLSLFGEVQKEVIAATLAEEYGVEAVFGESSVICVERVAGTGAAEEVIAAGENPFLATVGLRVEPGRPGSGVVFELGVEPGAMPYAFFQAVREAVAATLAQGLYGWRVPDCVVTMTRSGYWARQSHAHGSFDKSMSSTAGDFRGLTPLVLMEALRRAGTVVAEPVHRFVLEVPADVVGGVLPVLAGFGAVPDATVVRGSRCFLEGVVPAGSVHGLQRRLPGLTRGEGVLESVFERYEPVRGAVPRRVRTGPDPMHRREYLLRVLRRVPGV